jgi:hypothetical protein
MSPFNTELDEATPEKLILHYEKERDKRPEAVADHGSAIKRPTTHD